MTRKKPDPVSVAGRRALNRNAIGLNKKDARKLTNSKTTKSTKADNDATAILIMFVMLTFIANIISSVVNAVKDKFNTGGS